MMREEFLLHGVTSSTGGCAILIIINGPVRLEIGANATFNALGNSDRATSVIGRAIRLTLINLMDVRPGGIDRTTLGHPGKFSYCLAEDEEGTNWQPLSIVRGIPEGLSAVTVMAALAPRQIMNEWTTDPQEILETFAAEMRANQRHYSIYGGNYAVVIPKQLRDHIEAAGWTKRDIAEFLYERARIRRNEWADVGKAACAIAPKKFTPHSNRRIIFWWWPLAGRRAGLVPSFRRGWAARPRPSRPLSAPASIVSRLSASLSRVFRDPHRGYST
jgi:hypothetical protein